MHPWKFALFFMRKRKLNFCMNCVPMTCTRSNRSQSLKSCFHRTTVLTPKRGKSHWTFYTRSEFKGLNYQWTMIIHLILLQVILENKKDITKPFSSQGFPHKEARNPKRIGLNLKIFSVFSVAFNRTNFLIR